ncbi:MAG: hypothetical protein ACHQT8_05505 [Chlamydiales bacterium]
MAPLSAADAPDSAVSSANATYDGNTLVLTGHVLLDHGMGKMAADAARLQRQESGKEFPFSLIELTQNVLLDLKTGAKIECAHAALDFIQLKGLLTSQEGKKVVYSDTVKKGPLRLLGKNIDLKIAKKDESKKNDFAIEAILAKDEVSIEFGKGFVLHADRALYRKEDAQEGAPSQEFQGVVTAYPKDAKTPCRLTHEGDLIDAETVDLDLAHQKLSFLHPKGLLTSLLIPGLQKGELKFSSDHLLWDHVKNALTLKGHVKVMESVLGTLSSEGELEILQQEQKQHRLLKAIRTRGTSTLDFKDANNRVHHLLGHGPFLFDRERLRATFESPKRNGRVPEERQLFYRSEEISLFANQALMEYTAQEGGVRPTVLTLTGNIRLFSSDENQPRFALGDRLSLSTTTRTLILTADPGKRVLFIDEKQGMRIAAQEVHITRDPETREERVQGVGNVKFSFTDEENSLLKKIFPRFQGPTS